MSRTLSALAVTQVALLAFLAVKVTDLERPVGPAQKDAVPPSASRVMASARVVQPGGQPHPMRQAAREEAGVHGVSQPAVQSFDIEIQYRHFQTVDPLRPSTGPLEQTTTIPTRICEVSAETSLGKTCPMLGKPFWRPAHLLSCATFEFRGA